MSFSNEFIHIFSDMMKEKSNSLQEKIREVSTIHKIFLKKLEDSKNEYSTINDNTPMDQRVRIQTEYKIAIVSELSSRLFFQDYMVMDYLFNKEAKSTVTKLDEDFKTFDISSNQFATEEEFEIYKLQTLADKIKHTGSYVFDYENNTVISE